MPYLLNVIYVLLLVFSLPWLIWQSIRKGKYRRGFAAKFLGLVPRRAESGKKCLWLHAVSVGEVNLLGTLLKEVEKRHPEWECVISTTTATGMALATKKYQKYTVFYCPLDFSWAVKTALRRIRPEVLILTELELWPNLIWAAKRRGTRVAVINGRLGEKSFRGYRRLLPFIRKIMQQINLVAAQDDTYAERFCALGARSDVVHVTGSMKYDGAQTDRNNPMTQKLAALAGIEKNDIVLLAGSTQEPEEAMVLATYRELVPQYPQLRLIIVPRHPERFNAVAELLDSSGLPWQRRTLLEVDTSTLKPRILLVDVVGELGAWWGTAKIAFVGGSLGNRGGQNMIEPAAYGAAVSFGPNTWNFQDIVTAMLNHEAAVVVRNQAEFTAFVRRCLQSHDYAQVLGDRAQTFVKSQIGATSKTVSLLEPIVEPV